MGGQSELARAIGAKQQYVWRWLSRGRVPAEHCPAIERETRARGEPVTCEELRPDVDWSVLRSQAAVVVAAAMPAVSASTPTPEGADEGPAADAVVGLTSPVCAAAGAAVASAGEGDGAPVQGGDFAGMGREAA